MHKILRQTLLTTTLIIGVSLVGIIRCSPSASAEIATGQKAVIVRGYNANEYAMASFQRSVDNALTDGVNYIYLVIPVHQANIYSSSVYVGSDTPTDQALISASNYIHSKGAHVAFSMHDDSDDGQWRSYINPGDRAGWFASYGNVLRHYASLAQQTGAETMIIGTEMSGMTMPSSNSSNTGNWESLIASLRPLYNGKLTYSAQHDTFRGEVNTIGFWPKLDYIGVSAYYPLGGDDSISALMNQWTNIDNAYINNVSTRYNKPVIFTEVGYQAKSGVTNDPGGSYQYGGTTNLTTQSNAYQALFNYWNNRAYFVGVAFWGWRADPNAGGSNDNDYTPQNKPAEQVMKQAFTAPPTGNQGPPTTPTPPASAANYTASLTTTSATAGTASSFNYTITTNQAVLNALIDVEIYTAGGQRIAQPFVENQNLPAGASNRSFDWTPPSAGTYTIKLGIFTAGWQQNLYWNGQVGAVAVSAASTNPVPPTPPVTPPVTPAAVTPPIAVTPPAPITPKTLSIWWPAGDGSVSGVQPFKAVVDDLADSQYNMFWQVDGGSLNAMGTVSDPVAHKEALVDLAPWRWQPSGQYTISFVAKDLSGAVIASKSTVIRVSN